MNDAEKLEQNPPTAVVLWKFDLVKLDHKLIFFVKFSIQKVTLTCQNLHLGEVLKL